MSSVCAGISKKVFLYVLLFCCANSITAENIARDCSYTMEPEANYALCIEGNKTDLTDGRFTVAGKQSMWEQPGAVGWSAGVFAPTGMVVITLDLEDIKPLERIVFSTVSGSGVNLPTMIYVDVSTDGKNYYDWGCLTALSKNPCPPVDAGYLHFRFDADFQAVNARYVRLRCIPQGYYLMMDELEVYKAEKPESAVAADSLPPAFSSEKLKAGLPRILVESCVRRSYENVLSHIRKNWQQGLPQQEMNDLSDAVKLWNLTGEPESFDATYPIDDLQRKIFALNGKYWREVIGLTAPQLWNYPVYAPLSPLDHPQKDAVLSEITVAMMNGEKRSAALNITNPEVEPIEVSAALKGLPGTLFEVLYLDSNDIKVTSTVLREIKSPIRVPSGMTAQIVIRFEPKELAAGVNAGTLEIAYGRQTAQVPLKLAIAPVSFPKKAQLRTWLYDYLDFPPDASTHYGLKKDAVDFMRKLELDALVNTGVGYSGLGRVNIPAEQVLDAQNHLAEMDFGLFRQWMQDNRDFTFHAIGLGLNAETKFGGRLTIDDPQFEETVAEWARRWDAALTEMNADKSKIYFFVFDEPRTDADYKALFAWCKAIKKGAPELQLEVNPLYITPEQYKYLQYCDVINPLFSRLQENRRQELGLVANWLQQGKTVHTYSCGCGPFNSDPAYYRLQAWNAFRLGGNGSGFWSLSDGLRGDKSSFNMYLLKGVYYSPLMYDGSTYLITKHWEALREGTEDFEYLSMLQSELKRLRQSGDTANAAALEKFLKDAAESACFGNSSAQGGLCTQADAARCRILEKLIEMNRK